jgi:hypothetical protein
MNLFVKEKQMLTVRTPGKMAPPVRILTSKMKEVRLEDDLSVTPSKEKPEWDSAVLKDQTPKSRTNLKARQSLQNSTPFTTKNDGERNQLRNVKPPPKVDDSIDYKAKFMEESKKTKVLKKRIQELEEELKVAMKRE